MIRRSLLIGLAALVVIVGLLTLLSVWLLTTETGLRVVFRGLSPFLPDELEVQAVEGRLVGPVRILGLAYESDAFRLEVDESEIEWQLGHLWRERLVVQRVRLQGVRQTLHQADSTAPDEPFELPRRIDLPLELIIEETRIEEISLSNEKGLLTRIASVALTAVWDDDDLTVSDLSITAADFDLQGAFSIVPRGKYVVDAGLSYAVRPEGYAAMNGTINVAGNLEALQLTHEIRPPYGTRLDVEIADILEDPQVSGVLSVHATRLEAIHPEWPAVALRAEGQLAGDMRNLPIELRVEASAPAFGRIDGSLAGRLASESVVIESLVVSLAGEPSRLEGSGQLILAGEQPQLDLEARWQALAWPLGAEPDLTSPDGELVVRGHLDDYTIVLNGQLQIPDQTSGRVIATGSGNRESLTLSSVEAQILDGVVEGTASIRWTPDIKVGFRLDASDLNPAAVASEWPGQLSGRLIGEAAVRDSKPALDIEELAASGRLRSYDVGLAAAGGYEPGRIRVSQLALTSGSTRVKAGGRLGPDSQFEWSIESDDLGSLFPDASGEVAGEGAIRGDLSEPQLTATLSGAGLRYQTHALRALDLEMDLDVSGARDSRLDAEFREGRTLGVNVDQLTLAMTGRAQDHRIGMKAETGVGETEIVASGALKDGVWAFSLTEARFAYSPFDPWTLRDPARGEVSLESVSVSTTCWESGAAELCLGGTIGPDKGAAEFRLRDLPLSYLTPLLPADLRMEGSVSGTGDARWARSDRLPAAQVRLTTTPSRVISVREGEEAAVLELEPGNLDLSLVPGGAVTLSLDVPGRNAKGLIANLELSESQTGFLNRPLSGQLRIELQDIDFIADLIPEVDSIEGRIKGDVRVSGSPGTPQLFGELALIEGAASLTGPELQVREMNISLAGGQDGEIVVSARAKSGGGSLDVKGSANITAKSYAANLTVSGENFRVLNTAEAEIFASPALDLRLSPEAITVRGEVQVPRADIKVNTVPESAIAPSNDQIIVRPEGEGVRKKGPELSARVKLVLGEKVRFEGFGLEAKLEGSVTAVEKPGEPTTASGEIRVAEGRYQAYGQNLDIEKGRLIFAGGPLTQPGLDVRAVRRPMEGILVGVRVKGTLREPEFSMFSDPSMSQSEQLSYLVLGRPLGESTSAENSALNRAAIALGMRGGNFLAERLGGALGVDEIGIQSAPGEATEQAALVIGKYLSPKLYVIYGIGLIEPVSTLRLQYALSSKWKLVTESSALQSGGDIIYTIER